jgi:hypothetical protein
MDQVMKNLSPNGLAYFSTLKLKSLISSETSLKINQNTRRHIPEDNNSLEISS